MADPVAAVISPPPPPRITGIVEQDQVALFNWAWDFYNAQVAANEAVQGIPVVFDASDLPDPATSSVAQAQETANQAYLLAISNKAKIDAKLEDWISGTLTVAASSTTAVHTFADVQPDTSFFVVLSVVSTTGTPPIDSSLVIKIENTTSDFTITVNASTAGGNTVTFNFLVFRAPT